MKNFDSRAYSINDFLEWDRNNQLELAPKFQRRAVWSESARSYLMDTIVRGKQIPKVFIRQKINPRTQASIREVVDGQQRLRTILNFMRDGFQISKRHNPRYGGLFYSQLDEVDEKIQSNILNYEISVDLLVNMPDEEVLDVFGRLNSYAVVLNEQEKIHATHFGPFKTLSEHLGHKFNYFWINFKILTEQQVLRMQDAALCGDILIAMTDGVRSKKRIKHYFEKYEENFPFETSELEDRFGETINLIETLFAGGLGESEFRRIHVFYSLFTALFHEQYGIANVDSPRTPIRENEIPKIASRLTRVDEIFAAEDIRKLGEAEAQFLDDSRRATTDEKVRKRRTEYLVELINSAR